LNYNFKCWNTDEGCFEIIPVEETVEALYWAWNYEFNVHDVETGDLVFAPWEDDDLNSEMLEPFGLRVISSKDGRDFQDIKTGEIFSPPWRNK
jgi:hypothetical protein